MKFKQLAMIIAFACTAFALQAPTGSLSRERPRPSQLPRPAPSTLENGPIPLEASDWSFLYNTTAKPVALSNDASGALQFTFPVANPFVPDTDPGSVKYLETGHPGRISGSMSITLELITTGKPVFNYENNPDNTCAFDAHARPILDDGNAGDYDRWWANPIAFDLQKAVSGVQVTLTIPLKPDQWSSVNGEKGTSSRAAGAGFLAILNKPVSFGLTFGGGCFFGHGVSVSGGTAVFKILQFSTF